MIYRIGAYLFAGIAFLAVGGGIARFASGHEAVVHCATAVAVCLVPGLLTLVWTELASRADPKMGPVVAMGSSGIRMFGVLGVALLLYMQVQPFQDRAGFLLWIAGAYLFLLGVEIYLIVARRQPAAKAADEARTPTA